MSADATVDGQPDPVVLVRGVPDELVPDQEVDRAKDDRLGHGQIAQQLADLTAMVPVRSNVALYGAWGSGKSGIGNLLRREIAKEKATGFARFDAFKYAENPLRRNFISAVATELGLDEKKHPRFHGELYSGKTTTTFDVPKSHYARLALLFGGLLFGIFVVLMAIAAAAAAVQTGPFWPDFRPLVKSAVVASFTPAALLSALVVLASRALGVERKTDKADSSEQFESLFQNMIRTAGHDRVVVFVDELDRCSPTNVVATLDAVRTFLGNAGCVFVVAADRQAVEEALDKKLTQATPSDAVNPYYSSGSAYLDKVFQYQVNVPPLLQASVTRYAVDLVGPLPGVWKELGDRLDLTVSVLVPSHARSPRRVKNLLNAFVLTYRLAEARQASGRLHGNMAERADEIARLVCLRVEFPLFARDLVLDARLPEYVLRLSDGDSEGEVWEDHPHVTDRVKALSRAYANADLPVATLLSDDDDDDDDSQAGAAPADRRQQDGGRVTDEKDVGRQHSRQLLDYLSRTRSVRGPRRDLLFMESSGSAVGLDGELAERLEENASNGALRAIATDVKALGDAGRQAALTLLIGQSNRSLGLEQRNVALSLLAVAAISDLDVASRADELADALAPAVAADPTLIDGALHGAWSLGLVSERPTARELRQLVLRSSAARDEFDIAALVLGTPDAALDADAGTTTSLLTAYLFSSDQDLAAGTAELLLSLDPGPAARLLSEAEEPLAERLAELLAEPPAPAPAAAPATGVVTQAARQAAAQAAETADIAAVERDDPSAALAAVRALLQDGAPDVARAVARAVLRVSHKDAREIVEEHLDRLGEVDEAGLAGLLVRAATRRALDRWPSWLGVLPPAVVRRPELHPDLRSLLASLWARSTATDDSPSGEKVRAASEAVMAVLDHLPEDDRPTLEAEVREGLGAPVDGTERALERLFVLQAAEPLVATGAVAAKVLASKEAEDLPAALRLDATAPQGELDPLPRYAEWSVTGTVSGWARPGVPADPPPAGALQDIVVALHDCQWLPEPLATGLRLLARAALGTDDQPDGLPPLPDAEELDALRRQHGRELDEAVSGWIRLVRPGSQDLLAVTDAALRDRTPLSALLGVVAEQAQRYAPKERLSLVTGLLADESRDAPSQDVLRAAGIAEVPDIEVARVLADRYSRCTNGVHRRKLMETWEAVAPASDAARRHLVESVLIPMLTPKERGGSREAMDLAREYLPRLAAKQPPGTKRPLRDAVVEAFGKDAAAKVLAPLGYRVKTSLFRQPSIDEGD